MGSTSIKIKNKERVIIWAVDPTQKLSYSKNLITEMKTWSKHLDCRIQPVTVFSEKPYNLPVESLYPWKARLEDVAEQSLNNFLQQVPIKNLLPHEKIFIRSESTRKMASELAKYAENKKALLICANTRARKSWNPFRLGGFSETLVTISRTPVLLLNPQSPPTKNIPSLLFPTNFDQNSKNALDHLSTFAKGFHSKVLLYSQIENPTIYSAEFSGYWQAEATHIESILKSLEKTRKEKAMDWSYYLEKQNVKSQIIIDRQKKSLSADILEVAKKNHVSLIALASSTSPLTQSILGGIARDVLLQAKCPVLVFYHPKAIRKPMVKSKEKSQKSFVPRRKALSSSRVQHA